MFISFLLEKIFRNEELKNNYNVRNKRAHHRVFRFYIFLTFSLAFSIAPFRSILAGHT